MRSLKTMLIAGAAAGMMLGGASIASAQGIPVPEGDVRDCVREMCYNMRHCGIRPQSVDQKDMVTKRSEQSQGFSEEEWSCSLEALFEYFNCADGFGEDRVNTPVRVPLKPESVKAATPTNE